MTPVLLLPLLVALAGDGNPAPTTLSLAVARPASVDGRVGFDLEVTWPAPADIAAAAPKCTTTLALPDGTSPPLTTKVTSTGADSFTAHVEYAIAGAQADAKAATATTWRIAVKCPGIDSGAPQSFGVFGTPPNAHFVIAFGAKSRAEAAAWLEERLRTNALPTHNRFPMIVESEWVLGLKPGFSIVVVAVSDDKAVADEIARELNAHGVAGTYVKAAWWPEPEPLRLVVVADVVDANKVVPSTDRNEIFMLQDAAGAGGARLSIDESVRGRGTVWDDGRALLVFTRSSKGGDAYELAVSAPQTSCQVPGRYPFEKVKRAHRMKALAIECVQGD